MGQLFLRFPHLSEAICGELNNKSLVTWLSVSRPWNMYLTEQNTHIQRLYEIRNIEAIGAKTCHTDRVAWKEVFKKASKETLVHLKHAIHSLYRKNTNLKHCPIPPLHIAAAAGHELLFKSIFNINQDKHPKNWMGQTPLHYVAEIEYPIGSGYFGICKFIMAQLGDQGDKNPTDEDRTTPLHLAATNGHLEMYDYIMQQVDDKNPRDKDGTTPLHMAALNGHFSVCKLIRANVADKNPVNNQGETSEMLRDLYLEYQ